MEAENLHFAATEVAIYNEEEGAWYRLGDEPWKVRDAVLGPNGKYQAHTFVRVVADSYGEAFEKLFGHPAPLPALTRGIRRGEQE